MKIQKKLELFFLLLAIASAIIAYLIETLMVDQVKFFLSDLFLGVFGSSVVSLFAAKIYYNSEKKKSIIKMGVLASNAANIYSRYRRQLSVEVSLNSKIQLMNTLYIEFAKISNEFVKSQFAEEWAQASGHATLIKEYKELLHNIIEQAEKTCDYLCQQSDPGRFNFEFSGDISEELVFSYTGKLNDYLVYFDRLAS